MEPIEQRTPKGKDRSWSRLTIGLAVGLFIVAVAVVAVLWVLPDSGPRYGGKSAREWLDEVYTTNQPQAMEAFRKMRPETLPFVLHELQSKETAWDRYYFRKYPTLPPWLKKHLRQPVPKSILWDRARMVLMNEPDLRKLLPRLTRLLADRTVQVRPQIAGIIYNLAGRGDEALAADLSRCLSDPELDVRWTAAQTLGRIGPGAKAAVPALVAALKDSSTTVEMQVAEALWIIDRQTNVCAEAMRQGIEALPLGMMKSWGIVSLSDMTPGDASLVTGLEDILQNPDDSYRARAAEALGRLGPVAKDAELALMKAAQDGYPELRKAAVKALKNIDPEAAAKYDHK